VILKLLAKQVNDRYSDAGEVRQAIAPILTTLNQGPSAAQNGAEGDREDSVTSLENSSSHQVLLDRLSRGKMVGRESELAELKHKWDLTRLGETGADHLLLISGEAGIGKTRLLREFQVYTGLRDGYVLQGVAREQDIGTPYAIIATAINNYVHNQSPDVLRRQAPGFIAGEVVKLAPELADKIGYIPPNPPLEPEAERARLIDQVGKFILNMASEQPTLLLLDDLHFADTGSLEILETVVRRAGDNNALLIAGAFQDVALSYSNPVNQLVSSLNSVNLVDRVPLRRLPQSGVEQLLIALLDDSVSEPFVQSIYQATEGNPLFVEELIKSLAVDGQIVLKDGRWQQRDSDRLQVPGSIKTVLGGRLDRVDKYTYQLLQLAATVGRSFTDDILKAVSLYDADTIAVAVNEALQGQLIETQAPNHAQTGRFLRNGGAPTHYQFQHALIRETLYEEMRPLRRRQLHRRVAGAMELLVSQDGREASPAILAYHFIEGAEEIRAVPYLQLAGEAARRVYANTQAVDYLSQAHEILEDIALELPKDELQQNYEERFEILSETRNILSMTGNRDHEFAVLEDLLNLADLMKDKNRWVQVMSRVASHHWQVSKLDLAAETARKALDVARQISDRQGELDCLEQIARVAWTRRDPESMTYASEALVIAKELNDRGREGRLTELIGHIYTNTLHDPERAGVYFNQALEICREIGNRYEEAWTLWGMGGLALYINDFSRALEHYKAAQAISDKIGATLQSGWDLYHIGDAWYRLGDYTEALQCYQQAQVIFNASHHLRGRIYALISLGLVNLALGDFDKAGDYLERAVRQAEERNDMVLMFRSYEAISDYYRLLGRDEHITNAVRFANRVIRLSADGNYFEHELLGYYLRSSGFLELRDWT
ncbi:MAG: AAA family ATPase, partial [Chloroflexota bacterium]